MQMHSYVVDQKLCPIAESTQSNSLSQSIYSMLTYVEYRRSFFFFDRNNRVSIGVDEAELS